MWKEGIICLDYRNMGGAMPFLLKFFCVDQELRVLLIGRFLYHLILLCVHYKFISIIIIYTYLNGIPLNFGKVSLKSESFNASGQLFSWGVPRTLNILNI